MRWGSVRQPLFRSFPYSRVFVMVHFILQEAEREMKYRLYYQRVLKERLTALRKVRKTLHLSAVLDIQNAMQS